MSFLSHGSNPLLIVRSKENPRYLVPDPGQKPLVPEPRSGPVEGGPIKNNPYRGKLKGKQ